MGILNITPDSFSDGGRYVDVDAAVAHGRRMHAEGAAIIDIGGESTRPGATPVSAQEELDRVMPVVERLRGEVDCVLSIDTLKPVVMRAACAAGVELINDVNALRIDGAIEAARDSGAAVCLMHMQGEPRTMQQAPHYRDVVEEVMAFLRQRIARCVGAGIPQDRLLIDPGFGFGKRLEHNLDLLRRLACFTSLGCPLLAGLSRKSMFGQLCGAAPDQRLPASLAAATVAVMEGAHIVRAHDVRATRDAICVAAALRGQSNQPVEESGRAMGNQAG